MDLFVIAILVLAGWHAARRDIDSAVDVLVAGLGLLCLVLMYNIASEFWTF